MFKLDQAPVVLLCLLLQNSAAEKTDAASCQDRCLETYFPGKPCYCNKVCMQYENCCYDYVALCDPKLATSDSWVNFMGHTYKYTTDGTAVAQTANQSCRDMEAMLVSINSVEEFNFITDEVLRGRTLSAFIGGSDKLEEGRWIWEDGTIMSLPRDPWNMWYLGEPDNNKGAEHCSVITNYKYWITQKDLMDTYKWRDYSCEFNAGNEIQGYICEGTAKCDQNPCSNGGTCIYTGGEPEYQCLCEPNYVGRICQYEIKEGEIWTECGDTNLFKDQGVITSPLYPYNYPPNVRCQWYITTPQHSTISLRFTNIEIETSKNCYLDSVTVYDDHVSNNSATLFGPFCGGPVKDLTFTTSSNKAMVVFNTDDDEEKIGFKLEYSKDICGQGIGDSGCGTKKVFTSQCGEIQFKPQQTYPQCEWQIEVNNNQQINVTFLGFNLKEIDQNCSVKGLEVFDGTEANYSRLLGRYCGRRATFSVYSRTNQLYLRRAESPTSESEGFTLQYQSYESTTTESLKHFDVTGLFGSLFISDAFLYLNDSSTLVYQWSIKVPHGFNMELNWNIETTSVANLKIFKGQSKYIVANKYINNTSGDNMTIPYFQTIVQLNIQEESLKTFVFSFKAVEWNAAESNCFRPIRYDSLSASPTENNLVTKLQPTMLKITNSQGYSGSMYCKWIIRGDLNSKLLVDVIDANIYPMTEDCQYDGLVIYDGPDTTYPVLGPFCGTSLEGRIIMPESSELLVVFYSDPDFGSRSNGKLRILFRKDTNTCPIWQMDQPYTATYSADCGVILSPNFPGVVERGLWFWTYQAPKDHFFSVKVYYVRGPGTNDPDCQQSLKVIEIPTGASALRQREKNVLKLCGSTQLFILTHNIKLPPRQKMGIELNTVSQSIPQNWQFKMSFTSHIMKAPKLYNATGLCPVGYTEWRAQCYKYMDWVRIFYAPQDYQWQQSWQRSLEKCRRENGTLLSIVDEEEAYFIKYQLANDWFWYYLAAYGVNHRLIYLGLHNRNGEYKWTSGFKLSYADWYKPKPAWTQDLFFGDTVLHDIINDQLPQPIASEGSLCTGMLSISPFGSLNWVKIPCDYPMYRAGVICKQPVKQINNTPEEEIYIYNKTYTVCPRGFFMVGEHCLTMTSISMLGANNTIPKVKVKCNSLGANIPTEISHEVVQGITTYLYIWNHTVSDGNIFLEMSSQADCIILQPVEVDGEVFFNNVTLLCDEITKIYLSYLICETDANMVDEKCGAHEYRCVSEECISVDSVCDSLPHCMDGSDEINCRCGNDKFNCSNGKCVSLSLRCDFIDDCGDLSDELGCVLENCSTYEFTCASGQCIPHHKVCDFKLDCSDGSDEKLELCAGRCSGFQCYSGTCLDSVLQKDGVSDCPGLLFEDEVSRNEDLHSMSTPDDSGKYSIEMNSQMMNCPGGDFHQLKCHPEQNKCYDRSKACIYDTVVLNEASDLKVQSSCRDGFHLREKCAKIQCPGMYQCPGSYCIPVRKLCDGNKDCPLGQDEGNCQHYNCQGYYKCKNSGICIPHSEVCNGVNDCGVGGEDEKYCGSIDPVCEKCNCTGFLAFCEHNNLTTLPEAVNTTRYIRGLFLGFNNIQITELSFTGLHWLSRLHLNSNLLYVIQNKAFRYLVNLLELNLSRNFIVLLHSDIFAGFGKLEKLDLSYNNLDSLSENVFSQLTSLKHLIIENNPSLMNFHPNSFLQLIHLNTLESDAYKFCCIAPQVDVCTPAADEFSSCEDLMANYALQTCIWILGIIATIGNLFVVIWRLLTDHKKVASLFIINLGCSDFLMGVYLLIIAGVDLHYRGSYIVHADNWRSSSLCQIAGILAMLSSEVSVFMLTAITFDRGIAIVLPLKFGQIRKIHAICIVITGWIVCLFLSILPATKINYFGDMFFGRTGVCLPFQVSSAKQPGWEYSVFIFLVLNLISFISIFVCYTGIFLTVRTSAKSVGHTATSSADEYELAKKLVIIVASDFLCWVPIILIGFAALGGATIPPQVSAWIAVFILPLNSAINPLLYTVSAIDCKKYFKKKRRKSTRKTRNTLVSTKTSAVPVSASDSTDGVDNTSYVKTD